MGAEKTRNKAGFGHLGRLHIFLPLPYPQIIQDGATLPLMNRPKGLRYRVSDMRVNTQYLAFPST